MKAGDLLALLWAHRFRIDASRWQLVAASLPLSVANSVLALCQSIVFRRRLANTVLPEAPVFVVGHYRTGTTFLYELLSRDPRFFFPRTYQCFAPHHFLITERWAKEALAVLLPARRPMDDMAVGLDRPQEDEFALMAMGAPSPYLRMAFPNEPAPRSFIGNRLSERESERLEAALLAFYRRICLRQAGSGKRLLVKSVPHTARIARLAELFPGAKFVHIVRHPYEIFASLKHTWNALDLTQGFQAPPWRARDLDEQILVSFEQMYEDFESQRPLLEPGALYELRYEDLVASPETEVRKAYAGLGLGDFGPAAEPLRRYLEEVQGYRRNSLAAEPAIREAIDGRWARYRERYGYLADSPTREERHVAG